MARHLAMTATLDPPIYFCDSRSPWQRGSNENTNGLLRDYFPKGTDLRLHSAEHLSPWRTSSTTAPAVYSPTDHEPPSSRPSYPRSISPCCDVDWKPPGRRGSNSGPPSTGRVVTACGQRTVYYVRFAPCLPATDDWRHGASSQLAGAPVPATAAACLPSSDGRLGKGRTGRLLRRAGPAPAG
jgi:hypothetical protein